MSETFQITPTEHGVIRVFTVNLPSDQLTGFVEGADKGTALINKALGVNTIDPAFVETFPLSNLDGLGLGGYLTDGLGVAKADVAPYASRLNGMTGNVVIVLSAAFGGTSATITPTAPLKWIGTYTEEGASIQFEPLPSEGAKGSVSETPAKPPKSDARVGGMIATYALFAMFAFIGLIIWISG